MPSIQLFKLLSFHFFFLHPPVSFFVCCLSFNNVLYRFPEVVVWGTSEETWVQIVLVFFQIIFCCLLESVWSAQVRGVALSGTILLVLLHQASPIKFSWSIPNKTLFSLTWNITAVSSCCNGDYFTEIFNTINWLVYDGFDFHLL